MLFITIKSVLVALAIASPLISASPLPVSETALITRQGGGENPGGTVVGPLQDGTGDIIAKLGLLFFGALAGAYKELLNTGVVKPATGG